MKKVFTILIFLISNFLYAQLNLEWERNLNPVPFQFNSARLMIVDSNNDIILGGSLDNKFLLAKYNSLGDKLWSRAYENLRQAYNGKLFLDSNGNIIVFGSFSTYGTNYFIAKFTSNGDLLWSIKDSVGKADNVCLDVQDNIYLIGGISSNILLKYNSAGQQLINKNLNAPSSPYYKKFITVDENFNIYIATTRIDLGTNADFYTLKLDQNANVLWEKNYTGGGHWDDYPVGLFVDQDKNVIVTGAALLLDHNNIYTVDIVTFKYDSNGNLLWQNIFDEQREAYEIPQKLLINSEGDFYICGISEGTFVYKLDKNGNHIWFKKFYFGGSIIDADLDAHDNIYIASNNRFGDFSYIEKFDKHGNINWFLFLDSMNISILKFHSPDIIYSISNYYNFYTFLKFRDQTSFVQNTNYFVSDYNLFQNYPNPFNPSTKIKFAIKNHSEILIKIYDINGKEIYTLTDAYYPQGEYELEWNGEMHPSGIYFYSLTSGQYFKSRKMLLIK